MRQKDSIAIIVCNEGFTIRLINIWRYRIISRLRVLEIRII